MSTARRALRGIVKPVDVLIDQLYWTRRLIELREVTERSPEERGVALGLPVGRSAQEGVLPSWKALLSLRPLNGRLSPDSVWDDGYWSCLLSLLFAKPPARVLDVGCGPGQLAMTLAHVFPTAEYVGVDVNPHAIDYCRREFAGDHARFELLKTFNSVYNPEGDRALPSFPVEDGSVDGIVSISLWTHLWPEMAMRYFAESSRALKKGGLFIGTFLVLDRDYDAHSHVRYPFTEPFAECADMFYTAQRYGVAIDPSIKDPVAFSASGLEKILDGNGLSIERYLPGRWKLFSGRSSASHWQDVIVARKR